jgi:hypothetical protein
MLEEVTVVRLVKKFCDFYGTRKFITVFTTVSHWTVSLAKEIELFPSGTTSTSKGGCTPTASRQASRHETKKTKADVSIMTQTGVRRFS